MVAGVKLHLESNPILARGDLKQNLCTRGPKGPTETEPDLSSFSYLYTNTLQYNTTHICRHIYTFIHAITLLPLKTILHMDG